MGALTCIPDGFELFVSSCADSAILSRGVPPILAEMAREATVRNLCGMDFATSAEMRRRARAYFDETLRAMSARSSHPEVVSYRRSVIAALYADDLRQAGVCEERIEREVGEWLARVGR